MVIGRMSRQLVVFHPGTTKHLVNAYNKETVMGDRAETEVRAVIDTFSDGVRNRDIEAMESVIAHEPNIVFYGSQAGDKRVGWKDIKTSFQEQFEDTDDIQSEVLDSTISMAGDVAWAAYDLRYSEEGGCAPVAFESRWSCVLRRDPDGWKMVHMHHSLGR